MGDPEEATAPPTSLRSIQTSEADLPIEGSQRQLVLETPQPSSTKRRLIPGALLLIAAMLAVIIGLSVGLTKSNSEEVNSNIGESSPGTAPITQTASPAVVESRQVDVEAWIVSQEYSSVNALNDPDSPQSKAAKFMVDSTSIEVPTETADPFLSFQWMERYALAVFYYALNGDNWLYHENFLERTLPSCQWFSAVVQFQRILPMGASCTDATRSDRVDILYFCKYECTC